MKYKNVWLIAFGIIILSIGLVAHFYVQVETDTIEVYPGFYNSYTSKEYPYQPFGLILTLSGIIVTLIGFLVFLKYEE